VRRRGKHLVIETSETGAPDPSDVRGDAFSSMRSGRVRATAHATRWCERATVASCACASSAQAGGVGEAAARQELERDEALATLGPEAWRSCRRCRRCSTRGPLHNSCATSA